MARPLGSKDKQKRKSNHGSGKGNLIPTSPRKILAGEKKEEISRIIGESYQYFPFAKTITNEEIADRLNNYFRQCYEEGQIPTVEDMALCLGVTRTTLRHWELEVTKNRERAELIARAKEVLAAIDAKLVSESKIPQVTYIFRAKNYYDMRDQQEVVMTPNVDPYGDSMDIEKLQRKYLDSGYDSAQEIKVERIPEKDPAPVPPDRTE